MSSSTVKSLRKKADRLAQIKYVPLNQECLVCGQPTSAMHHVIYKSQSANLRYNPSNLVPLCSRCHCKHHLSGDPVILATIIKKKGQEWFDELQQLRHIICKLNKGYLKEVIEELSL